MGNIKLGNGLNVEDLKLGTTQILKAYMGSTQIFPDCTLNVIGYDNLGSLTTITLYTFNPTTYTLVGTYNLYHNGVNGVIAVGTVISTNSSGTPVFDGTIIGSNLGYLDVNNYYNSGTQYSINSLGVVTAISEHIT